MISLPARRSGISPPAHLQGRGHLCGAVRLEAKAAAATAETEGKPIAAVPGGKQALHGWGFKESGNIDDVDECADGG